MAAPVEVDIDGRTVRLTNLDKVLYPSGFTKAEVASVAKIYGIVVSLIGAGAGGWAVVRYGVARCLIIATVLIASTNLFFAMMVTY